MFLDCCVNHVAGLYHSLAQGRAQRRPGYPANKSTKPCKGETAIVAKACAVPMYIGTHFKSTCNIALEMRMRPLRFVPLFDPERDPAAVVA